jgi:hypothetical protein
MGIFVTYTPGLNDITLSRNPFSLHILYAALMMAGAMFAWTEARKYFTRAYPTHWLQAYFAW